MARELKWKPTTISPEVSGGYLAVVRFTFDGHYGEPEEMSYSKRCDGWNCHDHSDGTYWDKSRMKDMRDAEGADYYVYAWAEIPSPDKEELDRLEVPVC